MTLRMIFGDQLSPGLASLTDLNPALDIVLMAEVTTEATHVRHHAKKLVLIFSAMRHFARALRARGVAVDYIELDDPANTQSLRGEFLRAVQRHRARHAMLTEPSEYRVLQDVLGWQAHSGIPVEIRADSRFFCPIVDFKAWAGARNALRMEFFYRDMRRRTGILMEGEKPSGGKWNFDHDNRASLPPRTKISAPPSFTPDAITQAVITLVQKHFPNHVGNTENFSFPVTGAEARKALADFITNRLAKFGDYQDAMKIGAPYLFHALISTSLNIGLLTAHEICEAAEAAFHAGHSPINAAEGFIRQILGWREYVRGLYWLHMPAYATKNALGATRRLPDFYWTGKTKLNCLHHAISDTLANAYAHHIQRLMITGNFALLTGIHPDEMDNWYMVVYADAFDWVEMPNTRGMALYADGGILGSKPYAASGAYINRMSDYCKKCSYNVKESEGEAACPFNYLYWDFFARHAKTLSANPRLAMPYKNLANMPPARRARLQHQAQSFLNSLATA